MKILDVSAVMKILDVSLSCHEDIECKLKPHEDIGCKLLSCHEDIGCKLKLS